MESETIDRQQLKIISNQAYLVILHWLKFVGWQIDKKSFLFISSQITLVLVTLFCEFENNGIKEILWVMFGRPKRWLHKGSMKASF